MRGDPSEIWESQRSKAQKSQQRKRLKPEQPLKPAAEATEYAKSRPRRERQGPRMALGHTSESLELLTCEEFVGPPGSGAPQAQPFSVTVHPQVAPRFCDRLLPCTPPHAVKGPRPYSKMQASCTASWTHVTV